MTPGGRAAAAIEILEAWDSGTEPVDRILTRWARSHRFAGSGDRRAIADLVYAALRCWRSASRAGGSEMPSPRAAVIGTLRLSGTDPRTVFTGTCHAPPPLSEAETAGLPPTDTEDLPDWLLGLIPTVEAKALRTRAALDLRANSLKATPTRAAEALAAEGIETEPGPHAATCLRVNKGARQVERSAAYAEGLVEIQDAASQAAAAHAGAEPGMTVLDLCAGGGGKTLALGAAMEGQGRLHAHDIAPGRMTDLPARAARAGLTPIIEAPGDLSHLDGACDLVFVDAPCSGSGAWRRNPDAKWRLTPERLAELTATQDALLDRALHAARPGGLILYATCSLLEAENDARIAAFLRRCDEVHPDGPARHWNPSEGADGFFAARLRRAAHASS